MLELGTVAGICCGLAATPGFAGSEHAHHHDQPQIHEEIIVYGFWVGPAEAQVAQHGYTGRWNATDQILVVPYGSAWCSGPASSIRISAAIRVA